MAKTQRKDDYESAIKKKEEQISKEREVHEELDKLESDVIGLWDEFIFVPYGPDMQMRIKADLPKRKHAQLLEALKADDEVKCLVILCSGLYSGETKIRDTNSKFFNNENNYSTLKYQQIVSAYMQHQKKQIESATSFLTEKT